MDLDGERPRQPRPEVAPSAATSLPIQTPETIDAWLLGTDRLFVAFSVLMGLAWLWPAIRTGEGWGHTLANAGVIAVVLGVSRLHRRGLLPPWASVWLRVALTCVILPVNYFQTSALIEATRLQDVVPLEEFLFASDRAILGADYSSWIHDVRHPVVTEILQLCYASFYFLPLLLGIILVLRKKQRFLPEALWALVAVFLISYLGYVVFPARSPAFLQKDLAPAGGIWMASAIWDHLKELGRGCHDAFPSGHTAISALLIYGGWRYDRVALIFIAPVASALIFSTLYLQYHFVVDVAAGLALTTGVVLWQRARGRRLMAPPPQP